MSPIKNVVLLGAGNVATHLGLTVQKAGVEVSQVFSRTQTSAARLADKLNCDYTTDIQFIYPGAGLYLFSIADNALKDTLSDFPLKGVFAAHTSGSLPMQIIQDAGLQAGVFYPLQTFSRHIPVDFAQVPMCIEAQNEELRKALVNLARLISGDVRYVDSTQRETIHVAAVFACNFTNHLLTIAENLLEEHQMDFDILKPLIRETIDKAMANSPGEVQTGPAVRKDNAIIKKHIKRLSSLPDYQNLYTFISDSIIKKYHQ